MRTKQLLFATVISFPIFSCASQTRAELGPLPETAPGDVAQRGSEARTRGLTGEDQAAIVASVVRSFYRPVGGQARWIDPRPLAHERSVAADTAMPADDDRAEEIVRAVGLRRVCALGSENSECADRPGGVLRFSPAYSLGPDSALIFARYTPLAAGPVGEVEFRMVRGERTWRVGTRRSLAPISAQPASRAIADELLAADRAFGAAAAQIDLVSALAATFDDSVVLQIPTGFADGKQRAVDALRANPDNPRSRTSWAPIRAGISADGLHGFTFGYMTLVRPDSTRVPLKYLAYWVKRDGAWRVAAFKRRPRPAGDVSTTVMAPALPLRLEAQNTDRATIARHAASMAAAEKEFSDTAQVIGIGAAFERYGRREDAVNMGGPNDTAFVIGSPAIGRSVGAGYPAGGSPVSWAADYKTLVASSGDLGVTFGYIRPNGPPPVGQVPQAFAFFTIWKRDPGGPWRYVAE